MGLERYSKIWGCECGSFFICKSSILGCFVNKFIKQSLSKQFFLYQANSHFDMLAFQPVCFLFLIYRRIACGKLSGINMLWFTLLMFAHLFWSYYFHYVLVRYSIDSVVLLPFDSYGTTDYVMFFVVMNKLCYFSL